MVAGTVLTALTTIVANRDRLALLEKILSAYFNFAFKMLWGFIHDTGPPI